MKTSPEGRALVEAFEGLFLHPYQDSVGVWTIGYGHTTAAGGISVTARTPPITSDQADVILGEDLQRVEWNVAKCIEVALDQHEFDALVSFDFNTGCLHKSSIRTAINAGHKDKAMEVLLEYDHAGGKVLAGLTRRRQAEKLLFEGKVQTALDKAGSHYHAIQAGIPTATPAQVPEPKTEPEHPAQVEATTKPDEPDLSFTKLWNFVRTL